MKIYPIEFRYTAIGKENGVLLEIDMERDFEISLADKFCKLNKDIGLLTLLQTFNSNIIEIDSEVQQYKVNYGGEVRRLGFSRLSSGERLYAICYMAHETKTHIIVCEELAQLDMKHMRLFFKLWGNSKYIDIIKPNGLNGETIVKLYNYSREKV